MRVALASLVAGTLLVAGIVLGPPRGAPEAVQAAAPEPAPAPQVELSGDGRTYPGPYFVGRPDALLTITEYADFQ
jgi:hypothetical protein